MNKFVLLKGSGNGIDIEIKEKWYSLCILVLVTKDFDIEKSHIIDSVMDSYQIRPKMIYKGSKGYYYTHKEKGYGAKTTRTYLNTEEVEYNFKMLIKWVENNV